MADYGSVKATGGLFSLDVSRQLWLLMVFAWTIQGMDLLLAGSTLYTPRVLGRLNTGCGHLWHCKGSIDLVVAKQQLPFCWYRMSKRKSTYTPCSHRSSKWCSWLVSGSVSDDTGRN